MGRNIHYCGVWNTVSKDYCLPGVLSLPTTKQSSLSKTKHQFCFFKRIPEHHQRHRATKIFRPKIFRTKISDQKFSARPPEPKKFLGSRSEPRRPPAAKNFDRTFERHTFFHATPFLNVRSGAGTSPSTSPPVPLWGTKKLKCEMQNAKDML